ncbi:MAG: PorV/PorQ family protein, partial [Candidatus Latescibacterota bacterium]
MKIFVCFISLCIFCCFASNGITQQVYSESGQTGLSFLRIPPVARIAALGGAGVSNTEDASSAWLNPSLLVFSGNRSAQFSHTEWIEGIRQEYAAVSTYSNAGALGFSVQLFDSGDIELRGPNPTQSSIGTYSMKNVSLDFSYSRFIYKQLSIGITYKKLFEKDAQESAGGYAIDGGITWRPKNGLAFAAVARNYGRMGILKDERIKIPSDMSMGFLYSGIIPGANRKFTLVGDYVAPKYGDQGI